MGELQQCYEAARRGFFAREEASECGCGGCGWFLSQVDTLHECPVHHTGQRHPEDYDDDDDEAESSWEGCDCDEFCTENCIGDCGGDCPCDEDLPQL